MCVTLTLPADDIPTWTVIINERYVNFLHKIDGFIVEAKADDVSKKSTFSISDGKLKSRKKQILIITIFTNGTVMVQGNSFLKWKMFDLPNLIDISEGKKETKDEVESFANFLRDISLAQTIPLPDDEVSTILTHEREESCSKTQESSPNQLGADKKTNCIIQQLLERLESLEANNKN